MFPMKYFLVAGARPNFMKIAPIHKAFSSRRNGYSIADLLLVHTGQHYNRNMSDDFFRDLGIPEPDINLEVGSGSHAEQTARIMIAFEPACLEHRPDWVIVVGDVNSTVACALTAKKLYPRRSRRSRLALARHVHAGRDQPRLYRCHLGPSVHDRHHGRRESAERRCRRRENPLRR